MKTVRSVRAARNVVVSLLLGAASSPLHAQTSSRATEVPNLRLQGVGGVRSLVDLSGVSVSVDSTAYVAVFLLSPGMRESPLQVISPATPATSSQLAAGRRQRTLPLAASALLRQSSAGEPIIVAFVSTVQPNLDVFRDGDRWATDLVVTDTAAAAPSALVQSLATALFGVAATRGVVAPYRVMVQQLSSALPLNRYGGVPSASECLSEIVRTGWSPAFAENYGNSGELRPLDGGSGGCSGYRVDWVAPAPSAGSSAGASAQPPAPRGSGKP